MTIANSTDTHISPPSRLTSKEKRLKDNSRFKTKTIIEPFNQISNGIQHKAATAGAVSNDDDDNSACSANYRTYTKSCAVRNSKLPHIRSAPSEPEVRVACELASDVTNSDISRSSSGTTVENVVQVPKRTRITKPGKLDIILVIQYRLFIESRGLYFLCLL